MSNQERHSTTLGVSLLRILWPADMYNLFGVQKVYTPPEFHYPSVHEAWEIDWKNIGRDFNNAVDKLNLEPVR